MRNFWQGLLWGSFIGIVLSTAINKPQRKPLVERSANAVISSTNALMKQARKRLMHKFN